MLDERPMAAILAALGGAEFRRSQLSKTFVAATIDGGVAARLGGWTEFSEAIVSNRLEPPRIRLFLDEQPVPESDYVDVSVNRRNVSFGRVDHQKLEGLLRRGASLVLDSLEEIQPSVREAARDLEYFVGEAVQVNAYVTWGEGSGFGAHWDSHDVVIVQLEGTKKWTIYGQGRIAPMHLDVDHTHDVPGEVVWSGTLERGDVLHVPRGWWHNVEGTGSETLHLTFGFTRRTGVDALHGLVDQLRRDEEIRTDVDAFDDDALAAQTILLREKLIEAASSLDLGDYLERHRARLPPAPKLSLPWSIAESKHAVTEVSLVARAAPKLTRIADRIVVDSAGKHFELALELEPLMKKLVQHRSLPVDDAIAESGLDPERARRAIESLTRAGLLALR